MIWNAAIRLQSAQLLAAEISVITGMPATRQSDKGQPVSSRNPAGPKHPVTTWVGDVLEQPGERLELDTATLSLILDAVAHVPLDQLSRDLVVGASAKETGDLLEIPPDILRMLGAQDVSLIIDVWEPIDSQGST